MTSDKFWREVVVGSVQSLPMAIVLPRLGVGIGTYSAVIALSAICFVVSDMIRDSKP